MNVGTLFRQLPGQVAGSAVVSAYREAAIEKVTGDGAHAYAAYAHEIYSFYL
jgi:hypothetical protein